MQRPKHILTAKQFSLKDLQRLFRQAELFRTSVTPKKKGIVATLFYEPSTRTRLSFESAAHRLGCQVLSVAEMKNSSVSKGESLADTIRTVAQYADILIVRHHEVNSLQKVASLCPVPLINAGEGSGEHPTQALLDVYTIFRELGTLNDLKIVLMGDLKDSRTIHSLVQLLVLLDGLTLYLVPYDRVSVRLLTLLNESKIKFTICCLEEALSSVHVIYVTRYQQERKPGLSQVGKTRLILNKEMVMKFNPDILIMSPLPRNEELATDLDDLPNAAYFRQVQNGLYLRMALLDELL